MTSPKVCIDCSPLLVRSAGVKTYLYHWLQSLRALSPATIQTFLAPARLDRLRHEGGPRWHPLRIAALQTVNRLPGVVCDLAVPRCDIFHSTNLLRKVPAGPRLSATLHDMTSWILPEYHTRAVVSADAAFSERVLKRAAGIIAVSENTRRDAVRILGLDPNKIQVIYPGVAESYFSVSGAAIAGAAATYELRSPYLLSVGTIEPRKNIDTLLAAWNSLPGSFRAANELIVAGMPGWNSEATMRRLSDASREMRGVRYIGYVPEDALPGLTAGARALVYPSFYEGFGIPVAQALAAGCPVITSNTSSLPEITDGAALLIDPHSTKELSTAIERISESAGLRERLRADGIVTAGRYRWQTAAKRSLDFFANIA